MLHEKDLDSLSVNLHEHTGTYKCIKYSRVKFSVFVGLVYNISRVVYCVCVRDRGRKIVASMHDNKPFNNLRSTVRDVFILPDFGSP